MNCSTPSKLTPKRQTATHTKASKTTRTKITKPVKKLQSRSITSHSSPSSPPTVARSIPSTASAPESISISNQSPPHFSASTPHLITSHSSKRYIFTPSRTLRDADTAAAAKKSADNAAKARADAMVEKAAEAAANDAIKGPTATETAANASTDSNGQPEKKQNKFAQMYQKYGKLFIISYFGVYFSTLATLTIGLNVIPGLDASQILQWVEDGGHLERPIALFRGAMDKYPFIGERIRAHPREYANFGAAWCLTKVVEVPRFFGALAVTKVWHSKREAAKKAADPQTEFKQESDKTSV